MVDTLKTKWTNSPLRGLKYAYQFQHLLNLNSYLFWVFISIKKTEHFTYRKFSIITNDISIITENSDIRKIMAFANIIITGIMCRSYFHST